MALNLHRAIKPDWEDVPESERTYIQKVAAKTNGVVTPANIITASSTVLVLSGLKDINAGQMVRGSIKVGLGRLGDLADGEAADRTGTKSPTGAAVDVAADYVQLSAALWTLQRRKLIPTHTAVSIGVPRVVNALSTAVAQLNGAKTYSSSVGKMSMAEVWGTLGAHVGAAALEQAGHPEAAEKLGRAAFVAEVVTAFDSGYASAGYAEHAVASYDTQIEVLEGLH